MNDLAREIVLKSLQGFKVANAIHKKERLSQLAVARARHTQRAGKRLEDGFDAVVARAPIHHFDMDVGPCPLGKSFKKVLHQFGLQVECSLLPGLMPGEREHLRATLERLMQQL